MAYVSQEDKKKLSVKIKEVVKKYGYKVSLSVNNHSTLVAKIKGADDIMEEYIDVQMSPEKVAKREFENYKFDPVVVMDEYRKWNHNVNEYWISENYGEKGTAFLTELKFLYLSTFIRSRRLSASSPPPARTLLISLFTSL